MSKTGGRPLSRRDVWAWCLYDWANSAFFTSVATVLLPVYYVGLFGQTTSVTLRAGGLSWTTSGDALWAYTSGAYMLAAAVAAPALGAMADSARGKKWFLAGSVAVGALFTAGLGFIGPGQFALCSLLYIAAAFAWSAGNIFYDGFLPELSTRPGELDTISSAGYGIGYLGGGLMLAVNLAMIAKPGAFGLSDPDAATRVSFFLVAAWWAVFTIPLLVKVREKGIGPAGRPAAESIVRDGFRRLGRTLGRVRRLPELSKFLAAFLLYNTGVGTLMVVAAAYGFSELHLGYPTIVGCVLMVQFIGVPAAFGFALLARRVGPRNSIFIGVAIYAGVVIYAMQIRSSAEFWVLGALIALVQGGTQAISRSLFGSMIPPGMTAEFYGFFSVFNKVGSFVGPMLFGLFRDLTGSSRLAILFLVSFFVLGFLILLAVRVERGVSQAQGFSLAANRTTPTPAVGG